MTTVLFVDDEQSLRRAARRWLERTGVRVLAAENVRMAKECFQAHSIDGAFIDVWLKDGTGVQLVAWMMENYPATGRNVVLLSGDIEQVPLADGSSRTADLPVLTKPFELAALDRYVARWTGGTSRSDQDRSDLPGR